MKNLKITLFSPSMTMMGTEVAGHRCLAGKGLSQFHNTIIWDKTERKRHQQHKDFQKLCISITEVEHHLNSIWSSPQLIRFFPQKLNTNHNITCHTYSHVIKRACDSECVKFKRIYVYLVFALSWDVVDLTALQGCCVGFNLQLVIAVRILYSFCFVTFKCVWVITPPAEVTALVLR